MANRILNDIEQWFDDDGDPLNAGKITFYEPRTTTLKDTYTDDSLGTAHTNPVVLDANGRPTSPIWLNGEYKRKVTTSADVQVGLIVDNVNKTTASTVETGLIPTNGSYEVDSTGDGQPDDWTITPLSSATIAIDTSDSAHGKNSLLFTSGGNGGGTATSTRFDVLKGRIVHIEFTHKSSSATAKTVVDVVTYDKDDGVLSTLEAYSEGAANPTSYSTEYVSVTADATAVTAEIVVTGVDAAGTTTTTGTTMNMDGISVNTSYLLDEDDMVSDNDSVGVTQQSAKAYVDAVDTKIASLNTKIIEIGNWDMDATATVNIAHGVTFSKIRTITVLIRNDADNAYRDFSSTDLTPASSSATLLWGDATNIVITRSTAGHFDSAAYNDVATFNRGWITVQYTD